MCGIAGLFSSDQISDDLKTSLREAMNGMVYRGPDHQAFYESGHACIAHNRLSIIDTSMGAHQPMISEDGNYVLAFNGEIFNYVALRKQLEKSGERFTTVSDTEVLLKLLIRDGKKCLSSLNGFFAIAFYNKKKDEFLLARDRFGEKPIKYHFSEGKLFFSSETKTLIRITQKRKLNYEALRLYFQFNYIPAPYTIAKDCYKLMPGELIHIVNGHFEKEFYYHLPEFNSISDEKFLKTELKNTLHDAVKLRLISDVPLGSFLSGGIDSTIISGIARDYDKNLHTFSIGFPDEKHFDETPFAREAAKYLGTKHEVFTVNSDRMLWNFDEMMSRMDEPFADSSALAVYELCRQTRSKITVALSGDGADEMFAGYHKHLAHKKASQKTFSNFLIKNSNRLLKSVKGSRHSKTGNKIRQLKKYAQAIKLSPLDRYVQWASVLSEKELDLIFKKLLPDGFDFSHLNFYFDNFEKDSSLHDVLLSDIKLVLANDMLVKVDAMSMANSLEVRPPFLDYRLVELSLSVPEMHKIKKSSKKHILKETFAEYLPEKLIDRPKKGFEVPLHSWFNTTLKKRIEQDWLDESKIKSQGIFRTEFTDALQKTVFSAYPGDSTSTLWAMIVFQEWLTYNEMEL